MTRERKVKLAICCFVLAAALFGRNIYKSTQTYGPKEHVDELGDYDKDNIPVYKIMKERLEKRIGRRRQSHKPVDPQVLREYEKLRTFYLKEQPSKDPEIVEAMKNLKPVAPAGKVAGTAGKKEVATVGKDKATPSNVPPTNSKDKGKGPSQPPAKVDAAAAPPPTQPATTPPAPALAPAVPGDNAPKMASGPIVVEEKSEEETAGVNAASEMKAPSANHLQAKVQYLQHSIPPWSHSWQFTTSADFARRRTITVMAVLWHRGRIVAQNILYEKVGSTIPADDVSDLQITFRTKNVLSDINNYESKMLFDAYSNKDQERVRKFYLKLSNMNQANFKFHTSSIDLMGYNTTLFEASGKAPSTSVLKVKFFVTEVNNNATVAH